MPITYAYYLHLLQCGVIYWCIFCFYGCESPVSSAVCGIGGTVSTNYLLNDTILGHYYSYSKDNISKKVFVEK